MSVGDHWQRRHLYRLDAHGQPVPEPDLCAWMAWMEEACVNGWRVVGYDTQEMDGVSVEVSTVFLGKDEGLEGGPPLLWETMLFWPGHTWDAYLERYASRAAAEAGHQRWCAEVFGGLAVVDETLETFASRVDSLLASFDGHGGEDAMEMERFTARRDAEIERLREMSHKLVRCLDELRQAPHDQGVGEALLEVAQALVQGAARLVLWYEILESMPPEDA
jgi:hypothetical protein